MSSSAEALLRRRILEDIYDRMTDEEKKLFVQLTMQDRDHREIMTALQQQKKDLEEIKKKQNWLTDFGSDVTANLFTDGILWLGSKIFKKF